MLTPQPHTLPSPTSQLSQFVKEWVVRTHWSAAKLIDNEIKRQKSPVPNKRYKTLGVKWLCKVSAPHQRSLSADSDVHRNPQRFHTAVRYS